MTVNFPKLKSIPGSHVSGSGSPTSPEKPKVCGSFRDLARSVSQVAQGSPLSNSGSRTSSFPSLRNAPQPPSSEIAADFRPKTAVLSEVHSAPQEVASISPTEKKAARKFPPVKQEAPSDAPLETVSFISEFIKTLHLRDIIKTLNIRFDLSLPLSSNRGEIQVALIKKKEELKLQIEKTEEYMQKVILQAQMGRIETFLQALTNPAQDLSRIMRGRLNLVNLVL